MKGYVFEFDLKKMEESNETFGIYAVRYYQSENGIFVEIGDGYRHQIRLEAEYWNRILKILRDNELDKKGREALLKGLMWEGLGDYEENLIAAIKDGKVKEAI